MTRGFLRRFGGAFGVLALLLSSMLSLSSSVALAAPLTINVPCDVTSLVAAINTVNANADGGTITLQPHCTYTITTNETPTDGLPIITGNVTIEGQGATITRDSTIGTPLFRIFEVAAGAGTLNVDFLTITNGETAGLGGAILDNGTATVSNSTLSGNTAGNGGGISVTAGASLTLTTSTFGNTTTGVGGGGVIVFGTALVTRSTFNGNSAPINGGAINVQPSATLTLINSTLVNNTSGGLGGATSNLGTSTVTNVTFFGNSASAGDAIATGNTNVTLANSILDDQHGHGECNPLGTFPGSFNLFSDNSCGTSSTSNVVSASRKLTLGSLQFNGGQTQTMLPSANSTGVIDQIPVARCVADDATSPGHSIAVTADQPGISRPQGTNCDIGAVEVGQPILVRRGDRTLLTTAVYDAQRRNISSPNLTVEAFNVAPFDHPWNGSNGNLQQPFSYSPRIALGAGYQITVNTQLSPGTYALSYEIEGDPGIYIIEFRVI